MIFCTLLRTLEPTSRNNSVGKLGKASMVEDVEGPRDEVMLTLSRKVMLAREAGDEVVVHEQDPGFGISFGP